jgi:hypothetical protein
VSREATVPLATAFRSEIAEARRLGYDTHVNLEATVATIRLTPASARAAAAAVRAAPGVSRPVLHGSQTYTDPAQRIDALRQAFGAALEAARDAA